MSEKNKLAHFVFKKIISPPCFFCPIFSFWQTFPIWQVFEYNRFFNSALIFLINLKIIFQLGKRKKQQGFVIYS